MFKPSNEDNREISTLTLVNASALRAARDQGKTVLYVLPTAMVTPLARDRARDYGIDIEVVDIRESLREVRNNVVSLGADHGGYPVKEQIKESLQKWGYEVMDVGTHSEQSVDYPDFAYQVARLVSEGKAWRGIMFDGVGIGSCMMANKLVRVRAANCHNHFEVVNSRAHNNANVLCLGGKTLGIAVITNLVKTWLEEPFEGGRHQRRVGKIVDMDEGIPPV